MRGENLLVIVGAGASFDCLGSNIDPTNIARPPLTQRLAAGTEDGRSLSLHYPDVQPLLSYLQLRLERRKPTENEPQTLEDALAEYLARPGANTKYHVAAMRFYLRDLLWRAGSSVLQANGGITNYTPLVSRCYEWAEGRDRHACMISFNYDTLLESACVGQFGRLGFHPADLASYIDNRYMSVLKPHGSVLWAWRYPVDGVQGGYAPNIVGYGEPDSIDRSVVFAAGAPQDSVPITLQAELGERVLSRPALPALALPVTNKTSLVWPAEQDDYFTRVIPNGSFGRVLIIGWRAAEDHFLQLLGRLIIPEAQFLVVTGSDEDADETAGRVVHYAVQGTRRVTGPRAFTTLVESDDHLGSFLAGR